MAPYDNLQRSISLHIASISTGVRGIPSLGGGEMDVSSPATGESLGRMANGEAPDAAAAVEAAYAAFPGWRDTPAQDRAASLRRAAQILRDNAQELGWLDASTAAIRFGAMVYDVEICGGVHGLLRRASSPRSRAPRFRWTASTLNYTLREPLGVVARIGAFNHPRAVHRGQGRRAARRRQHAHHQAGRPDAAVGAAHRRACGTKSFRRACSTWSPAAATRVSRSSNIRRWRRSASSAACRRPGGDGNRAGATLKALTLELGGKNALIGVRGRRHRGGGRRRRARHELPLRHRPVVQLDEPRVPARGHPREAVRSHRAQGRRASRWACRRIATPRSDASRAGAVRQDAGLHQVWQRRRRAARARRQAVRPIRALANGFFVEPTVFVNVTDDMRIAREEIFGPVVSILRWSDEDDVVARVNALEYGLTCSIWTHDLDRAHRLAARASRPATSGSTARGRITSACLSAATSNRGSAARSRSRRSWLAPRSRT